MSTGVEEFLVGACFDNAPLIHDDNAVRIMDCGKAMGDNKAS